MQDDAIPTARIHPDIYPCNRAVVVHMAKFPARLPRSLREMLGSRSEGARSCSPNLYTISEQYL